jgi:hypothetical protein
MSESYKALSKPPINALRPIQGGDLKGKTDINPQWRYEVMDQVFGPCGDGWKYEIVKLWDYPTVDGTVLCFAQVNVYVKKGDGWGDAIPGIGGNTLVDMVKAYKDSDPKRAKPNDEGYKMAITDALSTALKLLGVAADIYRGNWDGTKYLNEQPKKQEPENPSEYITIKESLIDYINAGMFDHPDNVNAVIAKKDIAGMKKALAVAKEKEKKAQEAVQ